MGEGEGGRRGEREGKGRGRERRLRNGNNAELPIDPLTNNRTNMSHYTRLDKE